MRKKIKSTELKDLLETIYIESYNWSLNCCNYHPEMAQEVLQDSYIKALKSLDNYKASSSLKTWFYTIIRNTAKDHFRKLTHSQEYSDEIKHELNAEKTATQELRFRKSQDQKKIIELMEKLSTRERETLELVIYQDMTLQDAAKIMDITLGSASSYFNRAKDKMKGFLEKPKQLSTSQDFQKTWTYCLEFLSKKK